MIKFLIIGSKGMLGQELINVFSKDKDYEIIAWDREEIDITDEVVLKKKLKELKPDTIINAAAYNAVDKCEEDKKEFEKAKQLNGLAPGYLAKVAKEIDSVLVHYSTDYVFSGQPPISEPQGCTGMCANCDLHDSPKQEIGFKENDKPEPISKYGETKLMGEEEVKKKGEKYYIIRLSKLFGKPGKSEQAKSSFFDVILELGKKNEIVKAVDEETSCFTYAPDLAKKTKEIIEARKDYGIYHVVNEDPCTWYAAAIELFNQSGIKTSVLPVTSDEFPRPAKRPFYSVLINTKLNPLRSYKEALKEYLESIN